jgi:serine phosphatase RsbU (regulator of sigma subunit)
MDEPVERPATGIWHELLLGPAFRRVLLGVLLGMAGPAAITPVIVALDAPPGAYVVTIIPAVIVGRLWAGLVASVASFVLVATFVGPSRGVFEPTSNDWIALGLFVGVAGILSIEEAARGRARAVQERLAFLAEANRTLTTSLDDEVTLARLTTVAVPRIADWCAVHLTSNVEAGSFRHVAHSDPERLALVEEVMRRYPPDPSDPESLVARVIASGRPVLLRRVPQAMLRRTARDEGHLRLLRRLGLRSVMVAPLIGRGRPLGAITLATAESGRRYGPGDVAFVQELAATAALAIENARLHQERSRVAQILQNSLLPPEIPEIPGVEVAVRYRPAGGHELVGGDFYDVFEAGEGIWGVALGDVCGKGPEAAALTGMVRHTIRTAAVGGRTPSSVLEVVNRQIIRNKVDRFCTATLGRVRRVNGTLAVVVSCGGHPAPLVYRPGTTVEAADCLGTLLGVFPDPSLVDSPVELGPGDAIVFYTDGITERFERAGTGGDARLVALLWESDGLDADQIADRIYLDAAEGATNRPRDDLAIVVLRVTPD